jgi:hypothetical protein
MTQNRASSWSVTTSVDNGSTVATKAAISNQSHYVTSIHAGFSAAAAGKAITLTDAGATIGTFHVTNQRDILFGGEGLRISTGGAVVATMVASGTGGTIGNVTMVGYTA